MSIRAYRNNPHWRRSVGEKLDKVHFRNGHWHAECDSMTGHCSEHYDKHDPYESMTELARHVWDSKLGRTLILGGLAVAVLGGAYVATRR